MTTETSEPDPIEASDSTPIEAETRDTPVEPVEPVDPPPIESPPAADAGDDSADFEHEGRTYRVPRSVLPLLAAHADRGRQAEQLAAERRGLDSERESFSRSTQAERQMLTDGRELIALDWQVRQLEANDFAQLQQQDPGRAQQLLWQLTQLRGTRDRKARELQQRLAERQAAAARDAASRRDQAEAVLARDIEGWSPELQATLAAFARQALGITAREFSEVDDPRFVKLLHLAHVGQQAVQKLKAASVPAAAVPPAPTRTVGSASPASRNPDRMTTGEWMEHRKSQLRNKRN